MFDRCTFWSTLAAHEHGSVYLYERNDLCTWAHMHFPSVDQNIYTVTANQRANKLLKRPPLERDETVRAGGAAAAALKAHFSHVIMLQKQRRCTHFVFPPLLSFSIPHPT